MFCNSAMASSACGLRLSRISSGKSSALVKSIFWLGMVSVPVLSITIAFTPLRLSSAAASFISTFICAALPMATIKAVGVANPMAHGQAITSTATAEIMACGRAAFPPNSHHKRKVTRAIKATTGTKTRATRSTTRCTGALLPWASCTILMIWAKAVCSPICCALNLNLPCDTTVPASTFAPFCFKAGVGSPVIMLSSIYAPSAVIKLSAIVTTPSTGTFSPARTSNTSPTAMVAMGTSRISSPSIRRAVLGASPISCLMLPAVSFLARSSSSLPVRTNVIIITEASK